MIKPWPKLASRPGGDFRIFNIRVDTRVSPRTGQAHDFFVIDSVNWVNVIALTSANELVMVEQYRPGTDTVELEIPGGVMDPGEPSPELTGARELREETGYAGDHARVIGRIFPNPAIMSNTAFTVLIENCRLVHPVEFDHSEDLSTRLVPVSELPELVRRGQVRHAIVVVALYHFELLRRHQAGG
jgi:8-oxo-dGTP pyrophosphatase MutT (NUDIX family)